MMGSKKFRSKVIESWIEENSQEASTDNKIIKAPKINRPELSKTEYVEASATVKQLGLQFLNVLASYHNPNFDAPDWVVEVEIIDREDLIYIVSTSNQLSYYVSNEVQPEKQKIDDSLSMTFEELRMLTNFDADLIAVMIRNKGINKEGKAKPMTLIRPLSDLLFGAYNLFHLDQVFDNTHIKKLYTEGKVSNLSGAERFVFPWAISSDIGSRLYDLILENEIKNSLEIGLAFGMSALFMCQAHHNKNHGCVYAHNMF